MQISLNKNETKGNLEYYCTFPGSCQSLLSAVASLHPGDMVEKQGLVFWKGWPPKILLSGCVGTKSLKATSEATIGLSQRVFPRMAHQRSASHQRSLASTLLVLFLGDYLSCVCLCVCLCMCVLRANAMQADIKKKAQKIFRTGLTSHYAPATDGNEGVSLLSLHLHHAFLAFSSPTLSPSWLLPFLLGVPYVCSGLGVILAWSNIQIQNGGQMLWPPKAKGDHHYH